MTTQTHPDWTARNTGTVLVLASSVPAWVGLIAWMVARGLS